MGWMRYQKLLQILAFWVKNEKQNACVTIWKRDLGKTGLGIHWASHVPSGCHEQRSLHLTWFVRCMPWGGAIQSRCCVFMPRQIHVYFDEQSSTGQSWYQLKQLIECCLIWTVVLWINRCRMLACFVAFCWLLPLSLFLSGNLTFDLCRQVSELFRSMRRFLNTHRMN